MTEEIELIEEIELTEKEKKRIELEKLIELTRQNIEKFLEPYLALTLFHKKTRKKIEKGLFDILDKMENDSEEVFSYGFKAKYKKGGEVEWFLKLNYY